MSRPMFPSRLLLLGACFLALACHKKGSAERPSLAEARELPFEVQQSFVRLGRELRTLRCVRTLDWSHPTAECVNAVLWCSDRVDAATTKEMIDLPEDKYPHLRTDAHLAVYMREDLQLMQITFAVPLANRPNNIEGRLIRVAGKASDLADVLDEIFGLDDPGWNLGDAPKTGEKPAAPAAAPRPVAPPPAASAGGSAATPEVVKAIVKPPPEPKVINALNLMRTLKGLLAAMDQAGHDTARITDIIVTLRPQLEQADADIQEYRKKEYGPSSTEAVTKFADQAAKARNKLSKLLGALSAAQRRALSTTLEPGESPFSESDTALELARTEVLLAEDLSRAAP